MWVIIAILNNEEPLSFWQCQNYVHFHDIHYPFIYPAKWIYEGRAYNEQYLLRAFLMNNSSWSIQFFGDMLMQKYKERMIGKLKGCGIGSIWIQKKLVG